MATSANAQPWTPAQTTTAVWYDAADAGSVTLSGGNVSQWSDLSGNGRHATQTNGGNQPGYLLAAQNGLNVVSLNGSSGYFNLGTGLDWMAADASHTTLAVLRNDNGANLYGAANGGSGDASLHVGWNGSNYRMNRWGNDWGTAPVNAVSGEYDVLRWTWDEGGAKSVYANAQLEGMSAPTHASGLSAMAGGGRLGNVVGQGLLDADIGEFIILEGDATQEDIELIEGYLAWKWGQQDKLPDDHPFKLVAPGDPVAVPEPASIAIWSLLGICLAGYGYRRRRRNS